MWDNFTKCPKMALVFRQLIVYIIKGKNSQVQLMVRRVQKMDKKRKRLHELIEELNDRQIERLYQLVCGIFGRVI